MFSTKKILLLDAFALVVVILALLPNAEAGPQQLDGGVYDSPAAQEYWNRRYLKTSKGQGLYSQSNLSKFLDCHVT